MGKSKIYTSVALLGDDKAWRASVPRIQLSGDGKEAKWGCIQQGKILAADWDLRQSRLGKDLSFSVVITKPDPKPYPVQKRTFKQSDGKV